MIGTLLHPVFLIACFLGIANQAVEGLGYSIPVVHSYLDDLCIIPITLTLGLASYRIIWPAYQLTKWHIWSVVVAFALYFELYLPATSVIYTSDVWDILMYGIGAVLFDGTINGAKDLSGAEVSA